MTDKVPLITDRHCVRNSAYALQAPSCAISYLVFNMLIDADKMILIHSVVPLSAVSAGSITFSHRRAL